MLGVPLSRHKRLKRFIQNSRTESHANLAHLAAVHPFPVSAITSAKVKALPQECDPTGSSEDREASCCVSFDDANLVTHRIPLTEYLSAADIEVLATDSAMLSASC